MIQSNRPLAVILTTLAILAPSIPGHTCSPAFSAPFEKPLTNPLPFDGLIPFSIWELPQGIRDTRPDTATLVSKTDARLPLEALDDPALKAGRFPLYFVATEPPDETQVWDKILIADRLMVLPQPIQFSSTVAPPDLTPVPFDFVIDWGSKLGIPGSCQDIDFAKLTFPGGLPEGVAINVFVGNTAQEAVQTENPTLQWIGLEDNSAHIMGTLRYFGAPGQWIAVELMDGSGRIGPRSAAVQIPERTSHNELMLLIIALLLNAAIIGIWMTWSRRRLERKAAEAKAAT